jgi:hypothetical protein
MKFANPFSTDFWIGEHPDNVNFEYRPNVITFPGDHARANAAQAAMLLEADRAAVRRDELRSDLHKQRNRLLVELARIDAALTELAGG